MKKAKPKHAVPATWKTRGNTAVIDTTTMTLRRHLTGRLIPVEFFLAFRATTHANYAYGKKGEIVGNCLRCYGAKFAAPSEGSTDKHVEFIAPFLDAHIREGDLVWMAGTKDLYLQALNEPWPMDTLIKSVNIGTWYNMNAGVLKPTETPTRSLISQDRKRIASRIGLVARAQDSNKVASALGTIRETRAPIYYKSPAFK